MAVCAKDEASTFLSLVSVRKLRALSSRCLICRQFAGWPFVNDHYNVTTIFQAFTR